MSPTACQSGLKSDRDCILDLWRRNLPDASTERYTWLYDEGPARSWLVRSAEGAAVGAIGLMPRRMRFFGQTTPVGQAIDLNVDKEHRALGPALPGHNDTPECLARVTWMQWLEAARERLRALHAQHERVFLVGMSMGGLLCLALAAEERADAVVVVTTATKSRC